MKFAFGKSYRITGFPGEWKITALEFIRRNNFITLVRFERGADGLKKAVRNIDEKDLMLSVHEIKGEK